VSFSSLSGEPVHRRRLEVTAVVPTYRPNERVRKTVATLADQCSRVIVIDDGSGSGSEPLIETLPGPNVSVVRLGTNRGIAAALNAGVREALADARTEYVLTVDQDSDLPSGFVERAVALAERGPSRFDVVVPESVAGQVVRHECADDGVRRPIEPIQSGMLISRRVFESIGDFDESLVIDCVDTDFFLRTRVAGLVTALCPGNELEHSLGELRPTLRGRPGFAYHSPVRRYYITRNRLTMLRRYGSFDRRWMRRTLRSELESLAVTLAFGPHRGRQVLATMAGVSAFLRGQGGPIPSRLHDRLVA
jgi:rhamnosyltransferase